VTPKKDLLSGTRPISHSGEASTQETSTLPKVLKLLDDRNAEIVALKKQHSEEIENIYQSLEREPEKLGIQSKIEELNKAQYDVLQPSNLLETSHGELEKLPKSSTESVQQLNAQVMDLTGQLKSISDEKQGIQTGLDKKVATISVLYRQLAQEKADHSSTQEQLESALSRADDLARQLEQTRTSNDETETLKLKISQLEGKLQKSGQTKKTLLDSNIELRESRVIAVERVKDVETQHAEQVRQLEDKDSEIDELKHKLAHQTSLNESYRNSPQSDSEDLHDIVDKIPGRSVS